MTDYDLPQQFEIIFTDDRSGVPKVKEGLTCIMFKDILRIEEFMYPETFEGDNRPKSVIYTATGTMVVIIPYNMLLHHWMQYKKSIKGRISTYYNSLN